MTQFREISCGCCLHEAAAAANSITPVTFCVRGFFIPEFVAEAPYFAPREWT